MKKEAIAKLIKCGEAAHFSLWEKVRMRAINDKNHINIFLQKPSPRPSPRGRGSFEIALKNNLLGFSLVELSIVLLIIAVITEAGITSGLSVLETARQTSTNQKIAKIEDALMAFRLANDRLPCPATITAIIGNAAYGVESSPAASCNTAGSTSNNSAGTAIKVAEGAIPFVTLGLPGDYMYDGWGNRIRYAVDVGMVIQGSFSGTGISALSGGITINTGPLYPATTVKSSSAIYAIISHGKKGHGAYAKNGVVQNNGSLNLDEQTNCNCTSAAVANTYVPTYIQEQPVTQDTSNPLKDFDDIVVYKERWQMVASTDKIGVTAPGIYVGDTYNNRVQIFDLNGNYLSQFGSIGTGNGQFKYAEGIAIDSKGNIFVADYTNNRIQKFDNAKNFITAIGAGYNNVAGSQLSSGSLPGQFFSPSKIAIDANDSLWVADTSNNRIQKFDNNNNYLFSIPSNYISSGSFKNGEFNLIKDIAIDSSGNLWVTDYGNNRIQEFSNNGQWIRSIGGASPFTCQTSPNAATPACDSGSADGQFNQPQGIAIDKSGNILVADNGNDRIQEFTNTGTYIRQFANGVVTAPTSVATDPSGNVWISTYTNNIIARCTPDGVTCTTILTSGSGNGQINQPFAIYIPYNK